MKHQLSDISGRVWVFGDDVDTDAMAPGASLMLDWPERRDYMFPQHGEFIKHVSPGDIIIAGDNFGCGSSREQAVHNLISLGVSLVAARTFGRIFFRNAIANALPVVQCPTLIDAFDTGDQAEFTWTSATLRNTTSNQSFAALPYSREMIGIMSAGGLVAKLKALGS